MTTGTFSFKLSEFRHNWRTQKQLFCFYGHMCQPSYLSVCGIFYPEIYNFQIYSYFRCCRSCCYFRFPVVVAIIWGHFFWTCQGRKPQVKISIGRWNFGAVYHTSRDISISCLDGHIVIYGCRSSSKVETIHEHCLWTRHNRKSQVCRWKKKHFCRCFSNITCGGFLPPSTIRVCKNRSTIRGLWPLTNCWIADECMMYINWLLY